MTDVVTRGDAVGGAAQVVVLGAGLAGLVAAGRLRAHGVDALVIDERAAVGGRLATDRVGGALVDHGAQFFTVRSPPFAAMVRGWRQQGCPVREWARGFAQASSVTAGPRAARGGEDGHARLVVDGGMQALAEHLAGGLALRRRTCAQALTPDEGGWRVRLDGRAAVRAGALLCTPPLPVTLALLRAGGVRLPAALAASLAAVRYDPCLALLAVLDREPAVPGPGAVQFAGGPVSWLADNAAKGLSPVPAVTVHAAPEWSWRQANRSDAAVIGALLELVTGWFPPAAVRRAELRRWRYSRPRPLPQRAVALPTGPPLVLAGDAFAGPRVEGAARSGLAAADLLLDRLGR